MCGQCGKPSVAPKCDRCRKRNTVDTIDALRGKGTCPLCNTRPKAKGERYCRICGEIVAKNTNGAPWWAHALKYAVWRGYGIAFMPDGDKYKGLAIPESVLPKLPKSGDLVICLDSFVPGMSRDQIGRFKRAIMAAHGLSVEPPKN